MKSNKKQCGCSDNCHEHNAHHEHGACGCHEHHEHHEHGACGCHEHHEHHEHGNCGCHEHDGGCGCGHSHGEVEDTPLWRPLLRYGLGAIPVILSFVPSLPLPLRVAFAMMAYIVFGIEVYSGMIRSFKKKKLFTEFTLMAVASLGAFAIGEFADAAAVVYLYSLGEMLSDRAYVRSKKNISELFEITPEYATVLRDGRTHRASPDKVELGEIVLVVAGERVALDGIVVEGGADADTSSVTGEAMPLSLYEGVYCPSGSSLINGAVKLRVTETYENSVVSRLVKAVNEANRRKASAEKKITKFASVFTPLAFLIAFFVIIIGSVITRDITTWLRAGFTILVVSCPCSLVLSVPLTYFCGIGSAASQGIIFRGGEVMDEVKKIKLLAFDKTGTITEPSLSFKGCELYADVSKTEFLSLAHSALTYSPHAAAQSFVRSVDITSTHTVENIQNIGGRGLVCTLDGKAALFGNAALMREHGICIADSKTTAIFGAVDGVLLGKLTFASNLKSCVKETVKSLKNKGIEHIALISGDSEDSVKEAAQMAQIEEYYHSVSPHRKAEIFGKISEKVKAKSKKARAAYCGDGLNDSAVIAMSDVGIAMGSCGAALTVESADIVLMDDDIEKLSAGIDIAKRTSRIATQNIALSLGIKIFVLVLSVVASSIGANIPMELAIAADVGACLIAVLNALRVAKNKKVKVK